MIDVQTLGTLDAPPDSGAGASRVTHVAGRAAFGAAEALQGKSSRARAGHFGKVNEPVRAEFTYESQRGSTDATGYIAQVAEVAGRS